MDTRESLLHSYNEAANEYANAFYDELQKKAFDLNFLQQFESLVPGGGKVYDLGCGPGHITSHLKGLGLNAIGIDISENMIKVAKERNPEIDFEVGDMLNLHLADESASGVTAFFSIIHFAPNQLSKVFQEIHRVLVANGVLLFSCHFGSGVIEVDNWFDKGLKYHCHLYEPGELEKLLEKIGFSSMTFQIRKPYDFEYETERVYVIAHKI